MVPFNKFKNNIKTYIDRAKQINVLKIIFIGISYPDEDMILKNPDIIQNVLMHNKYIQKITKINTQVISIFPLVARNQLLPIFEDGYHPNQLGHTLVFRSLVEAMNS